VTWKSIKKRNNKRNVAIRHGDLADIHMQRGQLDAALVIRTEKQLPVFDQLGDVRSAAATHGKIALIYQAQGNAEAAVREMGQAYSTLAELKDANALTIGGEIYAQMLLQTGDVETAVKVLVTAIETYRKMGLEDQAQQIIQRCFTPPEDDTATPHLTA
jgi:tetratricopeptide (TPR) repeat protein